MEESHKNKDNIEKLVQIMIFVARVISAAMQYKTIFFFFHAAFYIVQY